LSVTISQPLIALTKRALSIYLSIYVCTDYNPNPNPNPDPPFALVDGSRDDEVDEVGRALWGHYREILIAFDVYAAISGPDIFSIGAGDIYIYIYIVEMPCPK